LEFPPYSWQSDPEYLQAFWKEGNALVERMIKAIYVEYGHPKCKTDGTTMTEEELQKWEEAFQIQRQTGQGDFADRSSRVGRLGP
jgi:hypothetical protein